MSEIQKADPDARRRALTIVLVALGLGLAGLAALTAREEQFQRWLEANADWLAREPWIVALAGLVAVAPMIALAVYLFIVGARMARTQRYPPPGVAVTRDTPVVTGRGAVLRGRFVQALCVGLILCALAIPAVLWQLFSSIGRAP